MKRIYLPLVISLVLVLSLLGTVGCRPGGDVFLSDDFSSDNGKWEVYSDSNGEVFYEGGWLHVLNYTTAPYDTLTISDYSYSDFVLEVDTKLVDGTDDNWHGVVCRYQGNGNYYVFSINADGYYFISRFLEYEQLALVDATYSSHINLGWDAVNSIFIECIGTKLSLSVNGHLLSEVTDNAFSSGRIGLQATSWDGSYSEVAFDNLVITEP